MMDLGTFPGGTYSYAFAVNGGQIAGYSELISRRAVARGTSAGRDADDCERHPDD